ncbi:MAG TPA: SIS domain-containing protein [Candidatus Paceibacterota bacterium]|nr:SIS domain-containing protein [Candidatus Paceibacterota bacterium]
MIHPYLEESIALQKKVLEDKAIAATFDKIVHATLASIKNGGKILVAGNGGSAADAQHFAAEFVAMYKIDRRAHPALALTTDTSVLTAVSNDHHFDRVFARQVEALGTKGDILFLLTTSGNSKNLLNAVHVAKQRGVTTVALLGKGGGPMKGLADYEIIVPSDNVPRIQEVQKLILHSVAEEVEKRHYNEYLS